jgi:hypothetical protein
MQVKRQYCWLAAASSSTYAVATAIKGACVSLTASCFLLRHTDPSGPHLPVTLTHQPAAVSGSLFLFYPHRTVIKHPPGCVMN